MPRLQHIIEQEELEVTDDGKQALFKLSKGDMRRVINILQVFIQTISYTHYAYSEHCFVRHWSNKRRQRLQMCWLPASESHGRHIAPSFEQHIWGCSEEWDLNKYLTNKIFRTYRHSNRKRDCSGRHFGRAVGTHKKDGFAKWCACITLRQDVPNRTTPCNWLFREASELCADFCFLPGTRVGFWEAFNSIDKPRKQQDGILNEQRWISTWLYC